MDVYHKVLAKLFEITGGQETVDVDLTELLKREGFFPSLDEISRHLLSESWVTESRENIVRITHWGAAEAKKTLSATPDKAQAVEKESNRLLSSTREFVIMLEEFAANPSSEKFKVLEKRFSELNGIIGRIGENI